MRPRNRAAPASGVVGPSPAWSVLFGACLLTFAVAASAASAQSQIYKSIEGGVTSYSDGAGAFGAPNATPLGSESADSGNPPLPYRLLQVAKRYPVQLYGAPACTGCDAARAFLITRGIPFDEKSVTTAADDETLQQRTGVRELPVLALGTKYLTGFMQTTWTSYLDAAGYPKISQLPVGWRAPPAEPLAPANAAAKPTTPSNTAPAAPTPKPAIGTSPNIRF